MVNPDFLPRNYVINQGLEYIKTAACFTASQVLWAIWLQKF